MAQVQPLSGIYASVFEESINRMCNPQNIQATAKKFRDALQKSGGSYSFGEFAKIMMPDRAEWGKSGSTAYDDWQKNVADIPAAIRQQLADTIQANLTSASPLPMMLKVGDNVGPTHDLQVKNFAAGKTNYIGVLMLCPNPKFPK